LVIIAVSYDTASLNRRMDTLQRLGHIVVPASSLSTGQRVIEANQYHLLLIGSTVSARDRHELANISKEQRPLSRIISVETPGTPPLKIADRRVAAGDETAMLAAITSIVSGETESDVEERRR
jgi:O-acetylhomoserine/O-acetylserine sulfhydrylase-like pyridoxal-dependent enzyme